MKKLLSIIICLLACGMSSHAATTIDPSLLPKGVYLDGDSIRVNIDEFLSDESNREGYIKYMNEKLSQDSQNNGAQITELTFETRSATEEGSSNISQSSGAKGGLGRNNVTVDPIANHWTGYTYTYQSIDGDNRPITLSAKMYIPDKLQFTATCSITTLALLPFGQLSIIFTSLYDLISTAWKDQVKWGLLNCHPTTTTNHQAPTGASPMDGAVSKMATERCLVICPDYCGYGVSTNAQHPYLVQDVTARNCIDGYLAALSTLNNYGNISKSSDFYTTISGYSQGGSVALACHKYIENGPLTTEERNKINLRETYCGDGPYCPSATLQQYMDWRNYSGTNSDSITLLHNIAYPCVLPLIVMAAKNSYDKDCMRTVKVNDYFSEEFLATGIVNTLLEKGTNTDALNDITHAAGLYTIDQMLSDKVIEQVDGKWQFKTESNEMKCLLRALSYNDLTQGWAPQHPIHFLHFKGDLVVPYANMTPINENIKNGIWTNATYTTADDAYDNIPLLWKSASYLADMIETDKSKWDHVSMGNIFYIWLMSGAYYTYDKNYREFVY